MRPDPSAWRTALHGARLQGRGPHRGGLGEEIQNPDHERGTKPCPGPQGPQGQELRRRHLFSRQAQRHLREIFAHIKRNFLKSKGADAIYMLGSGWRTLDIIKLLEQDLQVPVVHPVPARIWEIQKRLHVREPRAGYGYLLEAMP
jgi:hypothetical protein